MNNIGAMIQALPRVGCFLMVSGLAAPLWAGGGISADFADGKWVSPRDKLTLTIPPDDIAARHAIFIGNTDATALFAPVRPGVYQYLSRVLPLKPGETEVRVYTIDAEGNWNEAGVFPLKVLSKSGFEQAEVNPSVTLTIDSQWDEGHNGDAQAPERANFHDGSLQAGLQTRHSRGDLEITSSTNVVGSSFEQKALRFGEIGNKAPKVDLSDYLVEMKKGDTALSLGHVSYGNNPLIFSGVANRGVQAAYRINEYLDVGLTAQNGTSIVGFDNLLGLTRYSDHYIRGGTVGLEFYPDSPGELRMELSYVNARIQSQTNFDVGEVPDAEQSHGWGLRVMGNLAEGRLRYDASVARSTFNNPNDPLLDQGFGDVVPVSDTTDDAYFVEVGYDLLRDVTLGEGTPVNMALTLTVEKTDALYRSLAASPTPDQQRYAAKAEGTLGAVAFSLGYSHSEDNVDDVPSILKTRTREWSATLDLPLKELLGQGEAPSRYWPSVSLSGQRVHQVAANNPVNGGFSAGHLPDQLNDSVNVSLNWAFDHWDLGYGLDYSNQDNRQAGRELADFRTLTQSINLGLRPREGVSLSVSLGRTNALDREQAVHNFSDNGSVSLDWQIVDDLSFNGSYSKNYDHDSLSHGKATSESLDLTLNYRFDLTWTEDRKLPGQFFIRFSRQDSASRDNLFGFDTDASSWQLTSGLSFNF